MVDDAPDLTIHVAVSGDDGVRIEVRPVCARPFAIPTSLESLNRARSGLDDALSAIKRQVGSNLDIADIPTLQNALRELKTQSEDLTWTLIGGNPDRLEGLEDALKAGLLTSDPDIGSAYVEVRSYARCIFPFELLMWRNFDPDDVKDRTSLLEACTAFVGFASIIRRSVLPEDFDEEVALSQDSLLDNEGGLPVKFFYYAGLPGAQSERNFFERQDGSVLSLDGPWPAGATTGDRVRTVCSTVIFDPREGFSGSGRRRPDQVQHFACHCDATDPEDCFIRLGGENEAGQTAASFDIRVADIKRGLRDLTFKRRRRREWSLPFIFLNACSSSTLTQDGAGTFPDLFLRQGNRAFIGTETMVPDAVAAQLSRYFYEELLGGKTVGESLNAAKRLLVMNHGNPLGILYTLYGNPDLRIKHIVSKEAIN